MVGDSSRSTTVFFPLLPDIRTMEISLDVIVTLLPATLVDL